MKKIYLNTELTNEEYHAMDGISSSMIGDYMKSPFQYWYKYVGKRMPEELGDNPAFAIGTVTHALVLEPDLFDEQFIIAPKIDKRTKVGKEKWAEFEEQAKGKTLVKKEHYDMAVMMRDAVNRNPIAVDLLKRGEFEKSFFFEGLKVRTDHIIVDDLIKKVLITDLKTAQTIEPKRFQWAVQDLYLTRAGFYAYVVSQFYPDYDIDFGYIAVDKNEPSSCTVFMISQEDLTWAISNAKRVVELIEQDTKEYGSKPWIDTTPQVLTLELNINKV